MPDRDAYEDDYNYWWKQRTRAGDDVEAVDAFAVEPFAGAAEPIDLRRYVQALFARPPFAPATPARDAPDLEATARRKPTAAGLYEDSATASADRRGFDVPDAAGRPPSWKLPGRSAMPDAIPGDGAARRSRHGVAPGSGAQNGAPARPAAPPAAPALPPLLRPPADDNPAPPALEKPNAQTGLLLAIADTLLREGGPLLARLLGRTPEAMRRALDALGAAVKAGLPPEHHAGADRSIGAVARAAQRIADEDAAAARNRAAPATLAERRAAAERAYRHAREDGDSNRTATARRDYVQAWRAERFAQGDSPSEVNAGARALEADDNARADLADPRRVADDNTAENSGPRGADFKTPLSGAGADADRQRHTDRDSKAASRLKPDVPPMGMPSEMQLGEPAPGAMSSTVGIDRRREVRNLLRQLKRVAARNKDGSFVWAEADLDAYVGAVTQHIEPEHAGVFQLAVVAVRAGALPWRMAAEKLAEYYAPPTTAEILFDLALDFFPVVGELRSAQDAWEAIQGLVDALDAGDHESSQKYAAEALVALAATVPLLRGLRASKKLPQLERLLRDLEKAPDAKSAKRVLSKYKREFSAQEHHLDQRALGGPRAGPRLLEETRTHRGFHTLFNRELEAVNQLIRPKRGNSGSNIRKRFSSEALMAAQAKVHKKLLRDPEYRHIAEAFFEVFPHLKP